MSKLSKISRLIPYILIVAGVLGLLASFVLTMEKISLLQNPDTQLNCNLNPVLSCGSVIKTDQAEAFGFPNPFIGISAFSVLITVGVGVLAGAKYKRWFWLGLNGGAALGFIFVHWLIYQSLYSIGALCIYCMLVWVVTAALFWYSTLYNLENNNLKLGEKYTKLKTFALNHHVDILIVWYLAVILAILNRFWYYWSTLI